MWEATVDFAGVLAEKENLALLTGLGLVATLLLNAGQNLFLFRQLSQQRQQLNQQLIGSKRDAWNRVSELEISNPQLHRLLMTPQTQRACERLNDQEITERAFAHMVLDVLSEQYASENAPAQEAAKDYSRTIFQNPSLRNYWCDYALRDAFAEDFRNFIDGIIKE